MTLGRLQRILGMAISDIAVVHLSLTLASRLRFGPIGTSHWYALFDRPLLVYAVYLMLYLLVAFAIRWGEQERVWTLGRELRYASQTWIAQAVLSMVLIVAFKLEGISRLFLLAFFAFQLSGFFLVRLFLRWWMERAMATGRNAKQVLLVGSGPLAKSVVTDILGRRYSGYTVVGYITVESDPATNLDGVPHLGAISDLGNVLRNTIVDTVVVTLSFADYSRVPEIIRTCEVLGKEVCLMFDPGDAPSGTSRMAAYFGVPALELGKRPGALAMMAKRAIDVVGSLLMLILLSPLFLVVAIAIKLDSPGPVFFRQRRVGLNGREFVMYKFRSMVDGAEKRLGDVLHLNEMSGPVFKIKADPRITRVGRFIRKTSIDELPQLINVLRGEMSLVGPRPPLPREVEQYEEWHYRRLSVKPGITCVWQVSGRNEIQFDDWVRMDLDYIDRWSLWLDLKLLLKTVPAVIRGTGA